MSLRDVGFGGTGGSGFTLGPVQNSFGTNTSSKTQAETLRDGYATANPNWLASYDASSDIGIYLVYLQGVNVVIEPQVRVSNAWRQSAAFVAVPGTDGTDGNDGSAANLENVTIGHVPVKGADGVNFEDSGIIVDGSIVTIPAATLGIGRIIELSEGSGFIINHNNISGLNYTVIDALLREAEGSSRPTHLVTVPATDVEIQDVDSTVMTANPLVSEYTTQLTGTTWSMTVRCQSAMSNVKVQLSDTLSGIVTRQLPTRLIYESDTLQGFDFRAGENTVIFADGVDDPSNGMFYVGNSVLRLFEGRNVTITVQADSVSLLGNGTLPYFRISHGAGTPTPIAYLSDVRFDHPEVISFSARGQHTQVDAGTSFTGTFTFDYAVTFPDNIVGTGTLTQAGNVLSGTISKTNTEVVVSITDFTLGSGESEIFTLSFTDTLGNTFSRSFTIRARDQTEALYYGVVSDVTPANIDESTLTEHDIVSSSSFNINTNVANNSYIVILSPSDREVNSIINTALNTGNIVADFTKTENALTINSQSYDLYTRQNLSDVELTYTLTVGVS